MLAVLALELGDAGEALKLATTSRRALDSLLQHSPTSTTLQYNLGRTLTFLGTDELALARRADAEASERHALAVLEPSLAKKPSDLNLRAATSEALLALGDVLASGGRGLEATAVWNRSLATIDSVARNRRLTDHLVLQSAALMRLDRLDEARPIVNEVLKRGYRRPRWFATVRSKRVVPAL